MASFTDLNWLTNKNTYYKNCYKDSHTMSKNYATVRGINQKEKKEIYLYLSLQ